MLKKAIKKHIKRHHPWRTIKFDELAEIYISMSLRMFGFGVIGIFVPVFLYKNGYSLQDIFFFYTIFFAFRLPVSYFGGRIVGKVGPKHAIAMSTILVIGFLSQLLTLDIFGWPLWFMAMFFSAANGLFFLGYHTDFSKVNHASHGGKELGWLYIFERAGGAAGPVIGGILATIFSPAVTIIFAILTLLMSLVPLFRTSEPVMTNQNITFRKFPWRQHYRDFVSLSAFNIENVATNTYWPLFVAVAIFAQDTYAKVGAMVGLSLAISMFSARMFGKVIDRHKGGTLLSFGVLLNAVTHVIRSFISTGAGAIAVTSFNEPTTLSYRMPLVKGFYDTADSIEGYRIVYFSISEAIVGAVKALYSVCLFFACYFFDPLDVLQWNFILVALVSLGILFQRFPALAESTRGK